MLHFLKMAGILLCACALAACGVKGTYYAKSPGEVREAVRIAALPLHVLGGQIVGSRVITPDDRTVITALVGENDSEMIRFLTTIEPEGDGSRVTVELRPGEGRNKQRGEQMLAENSDMVRLMGGLANEHVAAAIEGRAFDMTFGASPEGRMMMAASPELRSEIEQANQSNALSNQDEVAARARRASSLAGTVWDEDETRQDDSD